MRTTIFINYLKKNTIEIRELSRSYKVLRLLRDQLRRSRRIPVVALLALRTLSERERVDGLALLALRPTAYVPHSSGSIVHGQWSAFDSNRTLFIMKSTFSLTLIAAIFISG